ncbi:MAG: D-aminoacyl-tRNA deacylase [Pseudomonadota bacterium]|nr:D-aminoacyl-tRNA deacylase [Pseudomonadota bacterium]
MRVLFQRVARAIVSVDDERIAEIGSGALLFVCVMSGDCPETIRGLAGKVAHLRVFNDEHGKLNRSLLDVGGEVLLVSQFTLAADTGRGPRPGFSQAAPAAEAQRYCDEFAQVLCDAGLVVRKGRFGADMSVELVNDGPVTIWLDSEKLRALP